MSRAGRDVAKTILVNEICDAARYYKDNLVGKKFLYIFENRYIEVVFKKEGFKHLTGVSSNLSALNFYRKAVKGVLQKEQIWFDTVHPFSLCKNKIEHIQNIFQDTTQNYFLLEDIQTDSAFYKFGSTETHFTLCMSIVNNTDDYIIKSLRDENCFNKASNSFMIKCILSKPNNTSIYKNIVFVNPDFSFEQLPSDILNVIDHSLLTLINT